MFQVAFARGLLRLLQRQWLLLPHAVAEDWNLCRPQLECVVETLCFRVDAHGDLVVENDHGHDDAVEVVMVSELGDGMDLETSLSCVRLASGWEDHILMRGPFDGSHLSA